MSRKFLAPIGVLARATDPTGTTAGEIYFNTTTGVLKQYSGTAWENLVAQPTDGLTGGTIFTGDTTPSTPVAGDVWIDGTGFSAGANILRWRDTAAGGETSLSGVGDGTVSLTYTPGYEQVYINGVLQVRGVDYTATTGTTITGITALTLNDVAEVIAPTNMLYGDYYTQAQITALLAATTPVGSVNAYAGSTAPTGWLLCDGTVYTNATYSALASVLGTTYGGVSGTSFAVPDLRGRTVAGKDNMGGVTASRLTAGFSGITGTTLGAAGGDERLQSHSHSMNQSTTLPLNGSGNNVPVGQNTNIVSANAGTLNAGAGASQNVQPTIILNYIIKAS